MDKYLYPNTHGLARQRLCDLELIENPSTIEQLEALPIKRDPQCLEIGAGAGSIARWLSTRVAGSGRVIATDIDTAQLDASTCKVWRHNVLRDPLPRAAFDRVHFRHLLIHLPEAKHVTALASIREALKPSGVLLAWESDLHSRRADPGTPERLRAIFAAGVRATHANAAATAAVPRPIIKKTRRGSSRNPSTAYARKGLARSMTSPSASCNGNRYTTCGQRSRWRRPGAARRVRQRRSFTYRTALRAGARLTSCGNQLNA